MRITRPFASDDVPPRRSNADIDSLVRILRKTTKFSSHAWSAA